MPKNDLVSTVALAIRLEAFRELSTIISAGKDDKECGRRALLIAFILDPKLIGTQRQLAAKMGVTEGRASQMLKRIRRDIARNLPALVDSR